MRCRPGEDDLSCSRLVASVVAIAVFRSRGLRGRCCLGGDDCPVWDSCGPVEGIVRVGTVIPQDNHGSPMCMDIGDNCWAVSNLAWDPQGRQCAWKLVTTVGQFQVLPRTSCRLCDFCLRQMVGLGTILWEQFSALSKIACLLAK